MLFSWTSCDSDKGKYDSENDKLVTVLPTHTLTPTSTPPALPHPHPPTCEALLVGEGDCVVHPVAFPRLGQHILVTRPLAEP